MASWLYRYRWGLLFLLPEIVIFIVFLWTPIVKGVIYSFQSVGFVGATQWVGLDNFKDVLSRAEILKSIRNTLYYMLLCMLFGYWVPCFFAVIVSEIRKFQGIARSLLYFPTLVPSVALYSMWLWFYDSVGPINSFVSMLGFDKIKFLTSTELSMLSIVIMETWQQFGAAFIIYIAGIAGIPHVLYEAAEIDGAGVWRRIWHITLPSIRQLLVLMFIMQIIGTSQAFQSQKALTDGGPVNSTLTYGLMIIREAFSNFNYGTASAMGVLMLIVLSGFSLLYMKLDKDGVLSK